ncbi:MAG: hydrolase [Candidatus Bathyarchaeota archaeon]|nr:hydrolase [Candidatus Bathyarchaeota archaeon]
MPLTAIEVGATQTLYISWLLSYTHSPEMLEDWGGWKLSKKGLLSRKNTILVIIDVQEKIFPPISDRERVLENTRKLIQFAKIIGMPIILTEQYPRGLGPTIPEIKDLIPDVEPIEKVEFSCFRSEKFREAIERLNVESLIIVGIETHICITQTAIEGAEEGFRVCVVSDATSSRNPEDKEIALERLRDNGVIVASTEMLIYELLKKAGTQEFREALKLIKS